MSVCVSGSDNVLNEKVSATSAEINQTVSKRIDLDTSHCTIDQKVPPQKYDISTEIETLGGFLIEKVKKIPRVGQVIKHESLKFVIEIVDKKRIKQVKLIMPKNK